MFIRKIGKNYYWYKSRRLNNVVITTYAGKATEEEFKKWQESKRKK